MWLVVCPKFYYLNIVFGEKNNTCVSNVYVCVYIYIRKIEFYILFTLRI